MGDSGPSLILPVEAGSGSTGSHPKLRLPHQWVAAQCRAAGLSIHHDDIGPGGLRVLLAVKQP